MEGFDIFGGDPDELRARLGELAEQMQGAQRVAWADNAIKLAVEMTVAAINRLDLNGSSDEQAMQVRDAIRIVFPESVTLVREARERMAARIEALGLAVEVLVNNAGFGSSADLAAGDRHRLVEMVRLHCETVVDLQARYSAAMLERGRGAVLNIASTAAFQPLPGTATYGATKAFVLSLSEATHSELAGTGVTVTAVCPGPVKTEFTTAADIAEAEGRLPGVFWTPVEVVARQAVEGADKGRRVVVPGVLNRAGTLAGQHTPRALSLPIVKSIWRRAV